MIETQATRPHYVANFRCIGPECEDTCCKGWDIVLDKKTYQMIPASSLRSVIEKSVVQITDKASDTNYARIVLSEGGTCPILTEDHLCSLQKEHGEDYLSATCSIYPRVLNKVDGELEKSLYLSCPEAARVVLLERNLMQAGNNGTYSPFREGQFLELDTKQAQSGQKPYKYFWQIRDFILSLLQNRTYPLWQRLFLLGMFCERLEQISVTEQEQAVPTMLQEYGEIISGGAFRQALDSIDKHIPVQLDLVMRLADQRMQNGSDNTRYFECVQSFLQGIQYAPNSPAEKDTAHYTEAYVKYYEPFHKKHEYIMENFLMNYVFKNLFPFGRPASLHHEQRTIYTEYFLLLAQYALIKGLMIGMAGQLQDAFTPEHALKLIQSFSKVAEHSPVYLKELLHFIEERKLKNPQGMAVLLRN